jgi:hypothetical protein
MSKVLEWSKAVAAAVGVALTAWSAVASDGAVSLDELETLRTVALGVLTALGVYKVRNAPPA